MKKLLFLLLCCCLVLPATALAGMPNVNKQDNVYIAEDETVSKNFYAVGDSINIEGILEKDAYLMGNMLDISGKIEGDLFVIGNNLKLSGEVNGSVFVIGSDITIDGPVARSLFSISGNLKVNNQIGRNMHSIAGMAEVNDTASIGWSLSAISGILNISADVEDDVNVIVGQGSLDSRVGGDMYVEYDPDGIFELKSKAQVDGSLTYKAINDVTIEEGAVVTGGIEKLDVQKEKSKYSEDFFFGKFISLLGMLVVGMFLVYFWRYKIVMFANELLKNPAKYLGWGVLTFLVTPLLCLLLLFTIIGIPLSGLIIGLYFIVIYLAKIIFGITLGVFLIKKFKKSGKKAVKIDLMKAMFLGVAILGIVFAIPVLGGFIHFLAILFGMGVIVAVEKKVMLPEKK